VSPIFGSRDEKHVRKLIDRATDQAAHGRFEAAAASWGEVVPEASRVFGSDHGITLTAREDLALNLISAGEAKRGLGELQDVIPDLERVIGADAPATLNALEGVAVAYAILGQPREADEADREVIERTDLAVGRDHPRAVRTRGKAEGRRWDRRVEEVRAATEQLARTDMGSEDQADDPADTRDAIEHCLTISDALRSYAARVVWSALEPDESTVECVLECQRPDRLHVTQRSWSGDGTGERLYDEWLTIGPSHYVNAGDWHVAGSERDGFEQLLGMDGYMEALRSPAHNVTSADDRRRRLIGLSFRSSFGAFAELVSELERPDATMMVWIDLNSHQIVKGQVRVNGVSDGDQTRFEITHVFVEHDGPISIEAPELIEGGS
jgi:Tetratricopeptide repeat